MGARIVHALGRRHLASLLALILLPGSLSGEVPIQSTFWFQSGFWTNLHHFLFQQAVESATDDLALSADLSPEEGKVWRVALEYYRREFDAKDLLERDMAAIKNALGDLDGNQSLESTSLDENLVEVLEAAAPVYDTHWWNRHDSRNRFLIAQLEPIVARHETWLKTRLSDVYRTKWPDTRIRTDIVIHANWAGAYTTLYPTRITIASEDTNQTPEEGLEMLFHEASHSLVWSVRQSISQRARALGKLLPRKSLWHAVLFYSTGEIVRQRLPGYSPYAIRHRLWEMAWPDHLGVLETKWKPYLDGDLDFDAAINALVDTIAVDP